MYKLETKTLRKEKYVGSGTVFDEWDDTIYEFNNMYELNKAFTEKINDYIVRGYIINTISENYISLNFGNDYFEMKAVMPNW